MRPVCSLYKSNLNCMLACIDVYQSKSISQCSSLFIDVYNGFTKDPWLYVVLQIVQVFINMVGTELYSLGTFSCNNDKQDLHDE